MDDSTVLVEEIDPNYEPSKTDIEEYALWLGLELPEDKDLLYIAREGLMAPLPEEWKPCKNKNGEIYYFNFKTGESVWTHPCDEYYKKMAREAKSAKAKRKETPTRKSSKSPTPKDFVEKPQNVPKKQPKLINEINASSEFVNRKNQMEQAYNEEIERIRLDFENQRKQLKAQIDKEIEREKDEILRGHKEKENKLQAEHQEKLEKQQDSINKLVKKAEQERENALNKEVTAKLEELKKEFANDLEEKKRRQAEIYKKDLEAELKRISILKEEELKQMQEEIDTYKERVKWEVKEQEECKQRYEKKLDRLKNDAENDYQNEVKKIEKEFEWQMFLAKEQQEKELSEDEKFRLNVIENELKTSTALEIAKYKNELQEKLFTEKEKFESTFKEKKQSERILREKEFESELFQEEEKQKRIIQDKLSSHRNNQELYLKEQLNDLRERLEGILISEERKLEAVRKPDLFFKEKLEERLTSLQNEYTSAQRMLESKEETLRYLQDDLNKIKSELKAKAPEKVKIETRINTDNSLIEEYQRQIRDKEREIEKFADIHPKRIENLEKEVFELKKILDKKQRIEDEENLRRKESQEVVNKWKEALKQERRELKNFQKELQMDREKWRKDLQFYKEHPSEKRRQELATVKKLIEKQIEVHNRRVKDLKAAEKLLKGTRNEDVSYSRVEMESLEEDRILDDWRNRGGDSFDSPPENNEPRPPMWAQYVRPAWKANNIRVYQREVNTYAKNREHTRDILTKHGNWLNNMKNELGRIAYP